MVKKIVCVLLTAIMVLQTAGCVDIRTTVLDKIIRRNAERYIKRKHITRDYR